MDQECIFCKIVDGTIPAKRLFENDEAVAFADMNPQSPTHLLVIPKRHIASTAAATAEDLPLLGQLIGVAAELVRRRGLDAGYRIVINTGADAGQTVNHLHVHLLAGRPMTWPPG